MDTQTHTHVWSSPLSRLSITVNDTLCPKPTVHSEGPPGKARASLRTWPALKSSGASLLTKAFGT